MASGHMRGNFDQPDEEDDIDYIPVGVVQMRPSSDQTFRGNNNAGLQQLSTSLQGHNAFQPVGDRYQQTMPNFPQLSQLDLDAFDCGPTEETNDSQSVQQLKVNHTYPGEDIQLSQSVVQSQKEVLFQLLQSQQEELHRLKQEKLVTAAPPPKTSSSHSSTPNHPVQDFTQLQSPYTAKHGDFNRNVSITGSQQLLKILSQPQTDNSGRFAQPDQSRTTVAQERYLESVRNTGQNAKDISYHHMVQPYSTPDSIGSSNSSSDSNFINTSSYEQLRAAIHQNSQPRALPSNSNHLDQQNDLIQSKTSRVLRIDTSERLSSPNIPKIAEQLLQQQSPSQGSFSSSTTAPLSVQASPHPPNLNQQHPEISKRLNSPVSPSRQGSSPWHPPSPRQPASPRQAVSPRQFSSGSPRQPPSSSPCQFVTPRQSVSPRQFAGSSASGNGSGGSHHHFHQQRSPTASPQSFHALSPRLPPSSPGIAVPPSSSPVRIASSSAPPFLSGAAFPHLPSSNVQAGLGQGSALIGGEHTKTMQPMAAQLSTASPASSPGGIVHHRPPLDSIHKSFSSSSSSALRDNSAISHAFVPTSKSTMPTPESWSDDFGGNVDLNKALGNAQKDKMDKLVQRANSAFTSQPSSSPNVAPFYPQTSASLQEFSKELPNWLHTGEAKGSDVNSNSRMTNAIKASHVVIPTPVSSDPLVGSSLEKGRALEGRNEDIFKSQAIDETMRGQTLVPQSSSSSLSVSISASEVPLDASNSGSSLAPENPGESSAGSSVLSDVAREQFTSKVVEKMETNAAAHKKVSPSELDSVKARKKNEVVSKLSVDPKKTKGAQREEAKIEEPSKRLRKPKVPFENDEIPTRGSSPKKKINERRSSSASQSKLRNRTASAAKDSSQPKAVVGVQTTPTVTTRSSNKNDSAEVKTQDDSQSPRKRNVSLARNSNRRLVRSMTNSQRGRERQLQRLSKLNRSTRQSDRNKIVIKANSRTSSKDASSSSGKEESLENRMSTRNSNKNTPQQEASKSQEIANNKNPRLKSSPQMVGRVSTRKSGGSPKLSPRSALSPQRRMTTRLSDGSTSKTKRHHLEFMESLPLHSRKRTKTAESPQPSVSAQEDVVSSASIQTRFIQSKPDSVAKEEEEQQEKVDKAISEVSEKSEKTSSEDSDLIEPEEEKEEETDEDFEAEEDDYEDDDEDYESSPRKIRRVNPKRFVQVRRSSRRRQKVKKNSEDEEDAREDDKSASSGKQEQESSSSASEISSRVLRKRSNICDPKSSKALRDGAEAKLEPSKVQSDNSILPSRSRDVASPASRKEDVKPKMEEAHRLPAFAPVELCGAPKEWSKVDRSKIVAYKLVAVHEDELTTALPDDMVPVVGYMFPGQVSNLIFLPSDGVKCRLDGQSSLSSQLPSNTSSSNPQVDSKTQNVSSSLSSSLSPSTLSSRSSSSSLPLSAPTSSRVLVTPKPISSVGVSSNLTATWSATAKLKMRTSSSPSSSASPIASSQNGGQISSLSTAYWNQSRGHLPPPQQPAAASSSSSSSSYYQHQHHQHLAHPSQSIPPPPPSAGGVPLSFSSSVVAPPPNASPTMTTPPPSASSSSSLSSLSWNSAPNLPWLAPEIEPAMPSSSSFGSWAAAGGVAAQSCGNSSVGSTQAHQRQSVVNLVESNRLNMQTMTPSSGQVLSQSNVALGMDAAADFVDNLSSHPQFFNEDSAGLGPDPLFTDSPQPPDAPGDKAMARHPDHRLLQGSFHQVTPSPSPNNYGNLALPGLGQQDISFLESKMQQDMDLSSSMLLSDVPYDDEEEDEGIKGHMTHDPTNLVCSVNLDDAPDTLALRGDNSGTLNLPAGVESLRDGNVSSGGLPLSQMTPTGMDEDVPAAGEDFMLVEHPNLAQEGEVPVLAQDDISETASSPGKKAKPKFTLQSRRDCYKILTVNQGGKRTCKCLICGKKYSLTSIYRHLRKHNNPNFAFHCDLCPKSYSQKHHLLQHLKKIHRTGPHMTAADWETKGQDPKTESKEETKDKGTTLIATPREEKEGKKKNRRPRSGERKQARDTLFYEEMPESPTPLDQGCMLETQRQVEEVRWTRARKKYAAQKTLNGIVTDIFSKQEPPSKLEVVVVTEKREEEKMSIDEGHDEEKNKASVKPKIAASVTSNQPQAAASEAIRSEVIGSEGSNKAESKINKIGAEETKREDSQNVTMDGEKDNLNVNSNNEKDTTTVKVDQEASMASKKEDLLDSIINAVAHSIYPEEEEEGMSGLEQSSGETTNELLPQTWIGDSSEPGIKTGPLRNKEDSSGGSGKTKYPCSLCDSVLSSKTSHIMHMRRHNHQKDKFCDYCGKGFITGQELRSHVRTHTGERPFECPICKATFAHSGSYQAHKKGHIKRGETDPFPPEKCHPGSPIKRRKPPSSATKGRPPKVKGKNRSESSSGADASSPNVSKEQSPFSPLGNLPSGLASPDSNRRVSVDFNTASGGGMDEQLQSVAMRRGSLDSNVPRTVGQQGGPHAPMNNVQYSSEGNYAGQQMPNTYQAGNYGMHSGGHFASHPSPQQGQQMDNYPTTVAAVTNYPTQPFSPGQQQQQQQSMGAHQFAAPSSSMQHHHLQHSAQLPPNQQYGDHPTGFYHHQQQQQPSFASSSGPGNFTSHGHPAAPSQNAISVSNPPPPPPATTKIDLDQAQPDRHSLPLQTYDHQNQYNVYAGGSPHTHLGGSPQTHPNEQQQQQQQGYLPQQQQQQQHHQQPQYSATRMMNSAIAYSSGNNNNGAHPKKSSDSSSNEIVKSLLEHYHVPANPYGSATTNTNATTTNSNNNSSSSNMRMDYSSRVEAGGGLTSSSSSYPVPHASHNSINNNNNHQQIPSQPAPPPPPYNHDIPPPPYTASLQFKDYYPHQQHHQPGSTQQQQQQGKHKMDSQPAMRTSIKPTATPAMRHASELPGAHHHHHHPHHHQQNQQQQQHMQAVYSSSKDQASMQYQPPSSHHHHHHPQQQQHQVPHLAPPLPPTPSQHQHQKTPKPVSVIRSNVVGSMPASMGEGGARSSYSPAPPSSMIGQEPQSLYLLPDTTRPLIASPGQGHERVHTDFNSL